MKQALPEKLETGRVRAGPYGSDARYGPYGCFDIQGPCGCALHIMSAAGEYDGWEHVSVSTPRRPPNWQEMCFVKDLFWEAEECVMQLHPPRSEYINNHPHCLHLWRPTMQEIPRPPSILVGDETRTAGYKTEFDKTGLDTKRGKFCNEINPSENGWRERR